MKNFLLTILTAFALFSATGCDSNVVREDATGEKADSLSKVMEDHSGKIDEAASELEATLEQLDEKLGTDEPVN